MHDLGPTWSDEKIWDHALVNDLVIVTNDTDFTDRAQLTDPSPTIVHLRLRNMRMREWHAVLTRLWPGVLSAVGTARIILVYRDRLEIVD